MDDIEGIQRIRHDDQLLIVKRIKETDTEIPTKRFKFDNVDELNSDVTSLIASQNELYYKIFDQMNDKNRAVPERRKKKMLREMLEMNNQAKPRNKDSTKVVSELSNSCSMFIK